MPPSLVKTPSKSIPNTTNPLLESVRASIPQSAFDFWQSKPKNTRSGDRSDNELVRVME